MVTRATPGSVEVPEVVVMFPVTSVTAIATTLRMFIGFPLVSVVFIVFRVEDPDSCGQG